MSMFSGPLARLRAQSRANNPDATPSIMDESSDPMGPAPAALANTLRQKVGIDDDPVMTAFNRYREAFAPAKAPAVEMPQGNKVLDLRAVAAKKRQQLVNQITQYQPGDPRRQALLARRAALEEEDSALNAIASADRSQAQLKRADAIYVQGDRTRDKAYDKAIAEIGYDGWGVPEGLKEQMKARGDFAPADAMEDEAWRIVDQKRPEGVTGRQIYEADIARAVEPRERLRQLLQQRKDDELNAQRQRDAEAGLAADTRALEGALGMAKLEQVRTALRNAKTSEEVEAIKAKYLPQQFEANLTAATDDNRRKNQEAADRSAAAANARRMDALKYTEASNAMPTPEELEAERKARAATARATAAQAGASASTAEAEAKYNNKVTAMTILKNDPELNDAVEALDTGIKSIGMGKFSLDAGKEATISDITANIDAIESRLETLKPEERDLVTRKLRGKLGLENISENPSFWDTVLKSGALTHWLYTEGNTPEETGQRRIKAAKQINRLIRILSNQGSSSAPVRDPERPM